MAPAAPSRRPARAAQGAGRRPTLILALLCGAQFLDAVTMSSVSISLPGIRRDLGFSPSGLQWVVSAYVLTLAGSLLVAGRTGDLVGRRRVFSAGLGVLAVFGLTSALAPSAGALVAARALQGAGAALTIPTALAMLSTTFAEGPARSRAMAAFGGAAAAGFTAGLVYGGVIDGMLGWRWVLGLTFPVAVAILAAVFVVIPADPPGGHATGRTDIPGAAAVTAALLILVYALTDAGTAGWASGRTAGLLALSAALLAAFVIRQHRGSDPLMPLRIWRKPNFAAVMAIAFCVEVPWNGLLYFATLTMQDVLRYSPFTTALAFLPLGFGGYVFSTLAGRMLPWAGTKALLVAGLGLVTLGTALFALVGARTSYWPLILVSFVVAVAGLAVTFVSASVAVVGGVDPSEQGLTGGLYNTALQIGSGVGLAVLAAVAAAGNHQDATGTGLLAGYHESLRTAAAAAALGLIIALLAIRRSETASPATAHTLAAYCHSESTSQDTI